MRTPDSRLDRASIPPQIISLIMQNKAINVKTLKKYAAQNKFSQLSKATNLLETADRASSNPQSHKHPQLMTEKLDELQTSIIRH